MEVVILAGGMGTRLAEETEFRPKPLVKIGTHPILWHIMKIYAAYGHTDFIIALGYKGELIKEYFYHYELVNNDVTFELGRPEKTMIHQCHKENGWRVTLADTGLHTLKGARLKKIEKYVSGQTFMMTYGDGVADVDLNSLLKFHQRHGKLATVTGVNAASRFGELKTEGDAVESFSEKPKDNYKFISGGFFVFNRGIFDYLSSDENCDLEFGALEELAQAGELMIYKHPGSWAAMDTIRDANYLNSLWNENKAFWKIWKD